MEPIAKRLAFLAALCGIGTCWGATIPLTKVALSTGYHPIGIIFWQLAISAAVLAAVTAARKVRIPLSRSLFLHYFIITLIGTLLPNSFSLAAVAQLPAGVMSIIIASVPMFAMTIALGFKLEVLSLARFSGVILGAMAVALLIGPQASLPDPGKAIFILVGLAAPLCYAIEVNYLALRSPPGLDPIVTLLGASIVGSLIALPVAAGSGRFIDLTVPWGVPEWALVVSALFHAIAYTGYIWLVSKTGPVFSSQVAYVVTLAGVIISAVALGENHSAWVWAALALMISGLALVQPRKAKAE